MPANGLDVLQAMFAGEWACSEAEAAQVAAQVRIILLRDDGLAYTSAVRVRLG